MRFIGLIGDAGSGKTTFLTAMLVLAHESNRPISANYHLHHVRYNLMPFTELAAIVSKDGHSARSKVAGALVGIDELARGADSYDFFTKRSRDLTAFISQSRKLNCEVYYTVQRFTLIPKRMRDQTSGFIMLEDLDKEIPHCLCPKNRNPFVCTCGRKHICEGQYRLIFMNDIFDIIRTETFNGVPWRPFFDTEEVIWPD